MKSFSWRYKSWLGIEGAWNPETRAGTINIVLFGALVGIVIGVAVKAPAS